MASASTLEFDEPRARTVDGFRAEAAMPYIDVGLETLEVDAGGGMGLRSSSTIADRPGSSAIESEALTHF